MKLDSSILLQFRDLPQEEKIQAEYIWIGGSGNDIRSKTKTLNKIVRDIGDIPIWNFDGSSTGQAEGINSEVQLEPVCYFRDPFRRGNNILVLCECIGNKSNTRKLANNIFESGLEHEPWFGIEQEYTLLDKKTKWPLGWPEGGYFSPQGPYYCSVGAENAIGRDIMEVHYKCCLYSGIKISGTNAEVMPSQWEYQIGPCEGIESGDHLWVSRYLMYRVCEMYDVIVSFDPKPVEGDWNGAGCHTNYSTKSTREKGGWKIIKDQIEKLRIKHDEHISCYGDGNERRLTGKHETACIKDFTWGIANRGCSIRVPRNVRTEEKGYYEDRRPSSNMDPYIVTSMIFKTTVL